jgi:hypothetical protein
MICSGVASEDFLGVALLAKAPRTCQYYFFKFIKKLRSVEEGVNAVSKQVLKPGPAPTAEHCSRFAVRSGPGPESRFRRSQGDGYKDDFATGRG